MAAAYLGLFGGGADFRRSKFGPDDFLPRVGRSAQLKSGAYSLFQCHVTVLGDSMAQDAFSNECSTLLCQVSSAE